MCTRNYGRQNFQSLVCVPQVPYYQDLLFITGQIKGILLHLFGLTQMTADGNIMKNSSIGL